MKICFVAYLYTHARKWIEYFAANPENEVHVLAVYPYTQPINGAIMHDLAAKGGSTLSGLSAESSAKRRQSRGAPVTRLIGKIRSRINLAVVSESEVLGMFRTPLFLLPLRHTRRAESIIESIRPDLVHCISTPNVGYMGGLIGYRPLVLSSWGTDFVYFAQKSVLCRWLTRKTLSRTDLYFADSLRDKYLAEVYGFCPSRLSGVMPATGGLKLDQFPMGRKDNAAREKLGIDRSTNVIISIRGFRTFHVNTQTLVEAVPRIVAEYPNTVFVIDGAFQSSGYLPLKSLAERLRVEKYIRFTDRLSPPDLADYLAASDIMVSVTLFDGLPISMLEGMAYGLIPVMSVHSPIQEWITDGENGYLFNPGESEDVARAILRALNSKHAFDQMRKENWRLLQERADYYRNMRIAEGLYRTVIDRDAGSEL